MTFEGETKILPIKGIERAGADNLCEDGAMNEVVGMEYKDGSYVPYTGKQMTNYQTQTLSGIKYLKVHKTSFRTNIIAVCDTYVKWMSLDDFNSTSPLHTWNEIGSGVVANEIEFVGNVICISTSDGVEYYIAKQNGYVLQTNDEGSASVELRVVRGLPLDEGGKHDISANGVFSFEEMFSIPNTSEEEFELMSGHLSKVLGLASKNGGLTGAIMVAYGWRLKNGEVINISNPIVLGYPNINYTPYTVKQTSDHTPILYKDKFAFPYQTIHFHTGEKISLSEEIFKLVDSDNNVTGISAPPQLFVSAEASDSEGVGERYKIFASAITNTLQIRVSGSVNDDSNISSLCIFMSPEIYPFLTKDANIDTCFFPYFGTSKNHSTSAYPMYDTNENLVAKIKDTKSLHLVLEVAKENLSEYDEWTNINLVGKLEEKLPVLESIKMSNALTTKTYSPHFETYNYRLHLYNFTQTNIVKIIRDLYFVPPQKYMSAYGSIDVGDGQIWSGYHTTSPVGGFYTAEWEIDIHCKYENGAEYSHVLNGVYGSAEYIPNIINPYVSCIDYNAYEIVFRLKVYLQSPTTEREPYKYFYKKISLTRNSTLNIGENIASLSPVALTEITDSSQYFDIPVETESNVGELWRNKLIVSDTAYPSYFPKDKTYTIGNGNILKLARLSIALSQDSFGRYPLLAFCTDGIYSLNVDTDGGAYTNITPFSREVCVNPNTICEIDGAVIFASSKGLMVATEKGVDFFTPLLNGEPRHLPMDDVSKGNGLYYYGQILNASGVVSLWNPPTRNASGIITAYNDKAISRQDFILYLKNQDTYINYVSEKNKLIVYNKTKEFIYWIDIPTRNTTKLYTKIDFGNGDYPNEKYYQINENNTTKEFTFDYFSSNILGTVYNVDTMFQTRPIKIARGLKGVFRVVLRGFFINNSKWGTGEGEANNPYCAELLVLGSLDGVHWKPIGKNVDKSLYGGFHDFGCETERTSVNYIMICFSASLKPNGQMKNPATQEYDLSDDTEGSHIDSIEITLESRDDGKR